MQEDTMLGGYRVLDLTEGGFLLGGQIFGDLGADVIKIEPPGGSPSRNIGPYYKDIPEVEKSLFWFAYNRNKRGITLDIETSDGREIFKQLVETADVIIESHPPGYMDGLGLGYSELRRVKPDIILTSVTPYGQEGPKAHYKGSDLTTWAASMIHSMAGDPDRAPTWNSYPSAGRSRPAISSSVHNRCPLVLGVHAIQFPEDGTIHDCRIRSNCQHSPVQGRLCSLGHRRGSRGRLFRQHRKTGKMDG